MSVMRRLLAPTLAALALLAVAPAPGRAQNSAEIEYGRLNADRAYRLGVQQYQMRNYAAAQRQFERATALAPDVPTYRRSLLLTKQRLSIQKANQKALQDSVNRARKGFAADAASEDARDNDPDAPPGGVDAAGRAAAPGATVPGATLPNVAPGARVPTGPAGSVGPRSSLDGPTAPGPASALPGGTLPATAAPRVGRETRLGVNAPSSESGLRDATRDLGLGGGMNPIDIPDDLPIAGTGGGDLPIGRLPPDMMEPPVPTKSRAMTMPGQDDGTPPPAAEPSMFPFLDPPKDMPVGTMPAAGPRLDTPKGPR
jgi:hypothetical protein